MDKKQNNYLIEATTSKMSKLKTKTMCSDLNKRVKFQNNVEIFKINESWKMQVQKSKLKTEEDQVAICPQ